MSSPTPPAAPPTAGRLTIWLATAGVAGAIAMALEMVAIRLYAPYLGNTLYVWGALIAVILAAMAVGYAMGGWLADRRRDDRALYYGLLIAAVYQLLILLLGTGPLERLSTWGELSGTIAATGLLFAPPVALLAAVGPFVTRLSARQGGVGRASGWVLAVSTAGSIVGVLGASFVAIPSWGTAATRVGLCTATVALGVAGLARRQRALLPLLLLPLVSHFAPEPSFTSGAAWVGESAYNWVLVFERGGRRGLALNRPTGRHSVSVRPSRMTGGYWDDFAVGPLVVPTRRALVLGLGGGTTVHALWAVDPAIDIDAVEIDPLVVEAARRFFAVEPGPRLRLHVTDARRFLRQSDARFDLVQLDLYRGGPEIPFYLLTEETFTAIRARLASTGLLMVNLFDPAAESPLLAAVIATLRAVFPTVLCHSRPSGNHILLAFVSPRAADEVSTALTAVDGPDALRSLAGSVARNLRRPPADRRAPLLTDDHAPVEALLRLSRTHSGAPAP